MKKPSKAHVNHERWMVSFADFMTLLFALFVILFSISSVDQQKLKTVADSVEKAIGILPSQGTSLLNKEGNQGTPQVIKPVFPTESNLGQKSQTLKKNLEQSLKNQGLIKEELTLRQEERGVVIQLSDSILFETGSERLKPKAVQVLYKLADSLGKMQAPLRIEGHTDNVKFKGGQSNWSLSASRATVVLQTLIQTKKIAPERLSLAAYGEYKPLGSNATEAGRAKNRRVDIVLLSTQAATQEPPNSSERTQATLEEELNAKIKARGN